MAEQLQLVAGGVEMPPRPSPTAVLRAICPTCGRAPMVGETTGLLLHHKYAKWDSRNRRGRCAGTGALAKKPTWTEPPR